MNKSIEVDLEEALPSVCSKEDPCVHRLVDSIHCHTLFPIEISVLSTLNDGVESSKLKVSFDAVSICEDILISLINRISYNLHRRYRHAYWIIYRNITIHQRGFLLENMREIPGVSFAHIDQNGYLCIEYISIDSTFEKYLNVRLDEIFEQFK